MKSVANDISDDGVKQVAEQHTEGQAEKTPDESENCADPELRAKDLHSRGADTSKDGEFVNFFRNGGGHSGQHDEGRYQKDAGDGDVFEDGDSAQLAVDTGLEAVGKDEFEWWSDGAFVLFKDFACFVVFSDGEVNGGEFVRLVSELLKGGEGDSYFGFLEYREGFAFHDAGNGEGDDVAIGTDLQVIADLNIEAIHDARIDQHFVIGSGRSAEEHGRRVDDPLLREIDAMHGDDSECVSDEFITNEAGVEFDGTVDGAEIGDGHVGGEAGCSGLYFRPVANECECGFGEFSVGLMSNAQVGSTHGVVHDSAD